MAEAGRLTGHVVAICPDCGERQMVAYSPASTPWPRCRVCTGEGWDRTRASFRTPRLVAWSDPNLVRHKRPGQPMTPTLRKQLLAEREALEEAPAPTPAPDRVRHGGPRRRRSDAVDSQLPVGPTIPTPTATETGTGRVDFHDHSADAHYDRRSTDDPRSKDPDD